MQIVLAKLWQSGPCNRRDKLLLERGQFVRHGIVTVERPRQPISALVIGRPARLGVKFTIAIAQLLYFSFLVCPAMATSIVSVRVKDRLVVGADSKQGRADNVPVKELFCKIGKADGFYFVTAGLVRVLDSELGFNAHTIITNAARIQRHEDSHFSAYSGALGFESREDQPNRQSPAKNPTENQRCSALSSVLSVTAGRCR